MYTNTAMTWADGVTESTQSSNRPIRPTYVPPHLRNNNNYNNANSYRFPTESTQLPPLGRACPSRGGGRGYGHRGRGRGRELERGWFQQTIRDTHDDISTKFDELEVEDDDVVAAKTNGVGEEVKLEAYDEIPVEASGTEIPSPVSSFEEIDLGESLNMNIKRCKYVRPTPIQRHAIPISLAGRDLMACAQTGSGKTAAFCFPIIHGILQLNRFSRPGRVAYPLALILSPTRELSCQVYFLFLKSLN